MAIGMPELSGGNVFGGAAIVGVVVGFWSYIKLYASKIFSLFVVRIEFNRQTGVAFAILLNKKFKCSPLGKKLYTGYHEYVRPNKRNQIVAFEEIPKEATIWWRGKRPLLVSGSIESLSITFVRGFYKRDELILEAVNAFNDEKNRKNWKKGDRFRVKKKYGTIGSSKQEGQLKQTSDEAPVASQEPPDANKHTKRPIGWTREEIGQPKADGAMDKLSLSADSLNAMKEALLWRDSEQWFKERSIPWKRGWLLHGEPGTGKTAFTRALGQELNMPIFSFDLATMTNKDFSDAWSDTMGWSPCIALFEDIDAIFKGRENIAVKGMENGLTFDSFLNCIDGVENTDGIFVIITTNDVNVIDPAIGNIVNGEGMSTRPGRIDRAIEFELLDRDGRIKMATRIMEGLAEDKWKYFIDKYDKDTGAQFQERCCRLALRLFWEEKKNLLTSKDD